jgi:hypothetical protein
MKLKHFSIVFMLFFGTLFPLKTWAAIYQIPSNQASNTTLNQRFVAKKNLSFKEKFALTLLKNNSRSHY